MIFRIYHKKLGGHVHMRVFSGKTDGALGKCGDLTMREEEFAEFLLAFANSASRAANRCSKPSSRR